MDVRLPDGHVIANVPEGTTQEQLLGKLMQAGHPSAGALARKIGSDATLAEMGPLDRFNAGMGEAFVRLGQGAKQMVGLPTEYEQQKEASDALNKTGAGLAGNVAGNITALAPLAVVPGAASIGGAATMGTLAGALQPTDTTGERLKNMAIGGTVSGAVQGAAQYPAEIWDAVKGAAQGVKRGAKALFEPLYQGGREQILARALRDATGGNTDVPARLAEAKVLVPGSEPTAAEVAQSPGLAALQRTAAAQNPEAYATRAMQQNEARVAELSDLAGTQGARDFAAANRAATSDQLYKQAYDMGLDLSKMSAARRGEITKLLKTPAIQDAVEQAKTLAANEFVNMKNPSGSVQGLDYVKRALDDQISKATGNEHRVLVALKNRLLTTIDTLSPEYAAARTVFKDMSRPIGQMDIAQAIYDKAINKLTGALNPAAYARALSDDTAAAATGFNKATLESALEPSQLSRLQAIKDDLARSVAARDLGRGAGSDTFQKLSMSNVMRRAGLPDTALRIPVASRVMNWMYENADNRMRAQLAEALLNPQETGRLLSKAPPIPMAAITPPAVGDRAALLARALALPAVASMETRQ